IPLDGKGRLALFDKPSDDGDDWRRIDKFFQQNYVAGADWRRIDGEWLGSATELALALQSYTNNTSLVLALEVGEPGKGDVLLFAALEKKAPGMVLRTDQEPVNRASNVVIDDKYFEVIL